MEQCKLCLNNDADETGSHLIPHFLLKRVVNVEGKKGRDQELGFTIGLTNTGTNFGRSVNTDKLDEIYGDLSDEDLENNIDPNIEDNIFCKKCEKRLATIESYYSQIIDKSNKSAKGNPALLFWISIFWRMSISRKYGQFLEEEQEEILRTLLDNNLDVKIENIQNEICREEIDGNLISYKLLRANGFSEGNPSHILFHPEFSKPYILLFDEFVIALTFDGNYDDMLNKDFYGLKEEINESPVNEGKSDERIMILENPKMKEIGDGIIKHMKNERARFIDENLNTVAQRMGYGERLPEHLSQQIYQEITSLDKQLGRKFTFEDMKDSIYKVLSKNPPNNVRIIKTNPNNG